MTRTLWIPVKLPGMNEIIGAANTTFSRGGKVIRGVKWNNEKKRWSNIIALFARTQDFAPVTVPAHYEIEFIEPDRRRDWDNVIAGQKLLFDALVDAKLLPGDSRKWVVSLVVSASRVSKDEPGVLLTVREENVSRPIGANSLSPKRSEVADPKYIGCPQTAHHHSFATGHGQSESVKQSAPATVSAVPRRDPSIRKTTKRGVHAG